MLTRYRQGRDCVVVLCTSLVLQACVLSAAAPTVGQVHPAQQFCSLGLGLREESGPLWPAHVAHLFLDEPHFQARTCSLLGL